MTRRPLIAALLVAGLAFPAWAEKAKPAPTPAPAEEAADEAEAAEPAPDEGGTRCPTKRRPPPKRNRWHR